MSALRQSGRRLVVACACALPVLCLASSLETGDVGVRSPAGLREATATVEGGSDLSRLARRLDEGVVESALERGSGSSLRAVLSLVARTDRPAVHLPSLVRLSGSRDRDIASRAAHAALSIARRTETRPPESCVDQQCDLVERREPMVTALREVLATEGLAPDVLSDLLSMLATESGRTYLPDVRGSVTDLLESPDASVRVAAATLMTPPLDEQMLDSLLDAAAGDDDARVVGACLVAACAAAALPDARDDRGAFEKRVRRFAGMEPGVEQAAPLVSCLRGIGEEWAEELASGLPAAREAR
jgi:hypothetical protein